MSYPDIGIQRYPTYNILPVPIVAMIQHLVPLDCKAHVQSRNVLMFWNAVPVQNMLYQIHRGTCIIGHVFLEAYGRPEDLQHYQTYSNFNYNLYFLF